MTAQEKIEELLHDSAWLGRTPGLGRITELLDRLENPQNRLKFVHIAGTNGKGSTAAMTASILSRAGYKTALFTSPHLLRLSERFRIDGVEIEEGTLEFVAQAVLAVSEDIKPTEFELMTAMGFLYFADQQCDIVVLEVGLGGRLDASNVIAPPEVAAITAIGLDHTALLGDSLPVIAAEKAGILKEGSHCVLYHQSDEVMAVVEHICRDRDVPLTVTRPDQLLSLEKGLGGQRFSYGHLTYEIPLLGQHQLENAMVALEMVEVLNQKGWDISQDAVSQGLQMTQWAGRLEQLGSAPDFFVDGGHNPQCLQALMEGLKGLYPHRKFIFLMGMLGDKNVDEMLALTLPLAKQVVAITPDSPRALQGTELATLVRARGISAVSAETVEEGVALAHQLAQPQDVICAFGSMYIVGTIKKTV